jgi:pyruvate,orthophosphate dikinase
MVAAEGILTTRGGMTSHAAVVARGMGKPCVAGCGDIEINYQKGEMRVGDKIYREGDLITLDGSTGEVFEGKVQTIEPELSGDFDRIMKLSDKFRRLKVRTNADTPNDSAIARKFGAEGIGLCRTEHMFFEPDRIDIVRQMIMAETEEERKQALNQLLPIQKKDFVEIFKLMEGYPVTIRLLDPPLHEFLPHEEKDQRELSDRLNIPLDKLKSRILSLHEFNPMLGHRGCRLAITYPEIYEMQVRAISEAVCDIIKSGKTLIPEIMIPLVATQKELQILRGQAEAIIQAVQEERGIRFDYLIGTMIELPRAAATADEIAEYADFFSFGTNDLTQTAIGISRDDASKFLSSYVNAGVFEKDPFMTIDKGGVGKFVKMGVEFGRKTKQQLKVGICGEHGGDPASIDFFENVDLDYVSCSPYRVPIARLAAAQAALLRPKSNLQ